MYYDLQQSIRIIGLVDPPNVPKLARPSLKDLRWRIVRLVLSSRQQLGDVSCETSSPIESRSVCVVLGHQSVVDDRRRPWDIPSRKDTCIFVRPGKDAVVIRIPRSSERTLAFDRRSNTSVGSFDVGIDNVHAIMILEGRVRAFPCRDTSAAIAEPDVTFLEPQGAKAVEEVSLSSDDAIVEVCAAVLAYVDLPQVVSTSVAARRAFGSLTVS